MSAGWVGPMAIAWPDDLLRATDLTRVALDELLALAGRMKAEPAGWTGALAGAALACLYEVPTTRAGLSAQVAAHRLGMEPTTMRPRDLDPEDEPLEDVGRILSGWSAAILVRDLPDRDLARLAGAATVPVVNALVDDPQQAVTGADAIVTGPWSRPADSAQRRRLHEQPRTPQGCEECLRIGSPWVHLRLCLTCGHVGCCDSSPMRYARTHALTIEHPIVRSLEGEDWRWCYFDETYV